MRVYASYLSRIEDNSEISSYYQAECYMYITYYLKRKLVTRIFNYGSCILSQTILLLGILILPASASQIWEGTGRIISGIGEGGSVELQLEFDGEIVRSLSGPPLDGIINTEPSLNGVIKTKNATWQIERCGEDLCVNLQQYNPKQTVFYRLQPKK